MLYTIDYSYDRKTGEQYVDYWFNDCEKEPRPLEITGWNWKHDHFVWQGRNGWNRLGAL